MKSHTPNCAKIEQFAATLVAVKTYPICVQDFDTKDYTLEFQGRSNTPRIKSAAKNHLDIGE